MRELLDKQVIMNAQKEKTFGVHASSRKPMKKCAMKMKEKNKEKRRMRKNIIDGRRAFVGYL